MDNVFGVGLPEFVLILVIAGMVMGPERIARAARALGVLTARLQKVSRSFFRQLNAELDSVDESGQLKSTAEELNQLRRQVTDLRNELFSLTSGVATEGKRAISEIKHETERSIMPPKPQAKSRRLIPSPQNDSMSVYRPPSLFGADSATSVRDVNGSDVPPVNPPPGLPNRTDIPEDPD